MLIIVIFFSCNNPVSEVSINNNHGTNYDSCGFGILTVVNNSWNNYQVLIDGMLAFTVNLKSSNGGPVSLGYHNFRIGIPQNYIIDTTFFIDDCRTYILYCQTY